MKRMYSLYHTLDTGHPLIIFGLYVDGDDEDVETTSEMRIEWKQLRNLSPYLEAYDDSWKALATFTDLIQELAKLDGTDPSPVVVIEALVRCGFAEYPA